MVAPDAVSEEDIEKLIIPDDLPDEPTFKAYIEATVYDKEGHPIEYRKQPMRSLTQYFLALMSIPLIGTYQSSSIDQAQNILVNVLGLPSQQTTYASGNKDSAIILWDFSIQLGSGTQAFSITLNSLAAPISNGSGAGQLIYEGVNVAYTSTSISAFVITFNQSPGAINVTEIGLQGTIYIAYGNSSALYAVNSYSFLLSYDTFTTAISIPPGGLAEFQIVISFTG